ncbi:MAG: CbbX protein, partial [Mesorhizobium sp.]
MLDAIAKGAAAQDESVDLQAEFEASNIDEVMDKLDR